MKKLTSKEVMNLAFENGLQTIEENGYKSSCDYILSFKEWSKETGSKSKKNYQTSMPSVERF